MELYGMEENIKITDYYQKVYMKKEKLSKEKYFSIILIIIYIKKEIKIQ